MDRELHWIEDFATYRLPSVRWDRPDEEEILDVNDGYAQWTLKFGRDFELTEELNKEDDSDFAFVSVLRSIQDGGVAGLSTRPRRAPSGLPVETFTQLNGPLDFGGFVGAGQSETKQLVVRMPLRRRSIASGKIAPPGYKLPSPAPDGDRAVIIGVIDDAINIAHRRFQMADGCSRVDFAWIQDADAMANPTVPFGREWTNTDISDVIRRYDGDDDRCMAALQLIGDPSRSYRPSPLRLRSSHGTHVADLAAGYGDDAAEAIDRRLVTVQLPALASQDTSGASLIASVVAAADYIFSRAQLISEAYGRAIPVILNFSYGLRGGPRNGLHVLERSLRGHAKQYIKEMNDEYGTDDAVAEVVMPAGNAHLMRTHATTPPRDVATEPARTLDVQSRIQPEDRTSTYVEFWVPADVGKVNLRIRRPGRNTADELVFDNLTAGHLPNEDDQRAFVLARPQDPDADEIEPDPRTVIARVKIDEPNDAPSDPQFRPTGPHWRILVAIAPTLLLDKDRLAAPHGLWEFSLSVATLPEGGRILAWIQRDEAVSGFGLRGRQAYFEDDVYEDRHRFDRLGDVAVSALDASPSVVRRDGTISGIATNPLIHWPTGKTDRAERADVKPDDKPLLVVGGYQWRSKAGTVYSAAGSDRIEWPLVMAPTDTSRALPGILASGSRSETRVAVNGTSIAAPQVVRSLADELSNLGPDQRANFNALTFLSCEAAAPKRPGANSPDDERASSCVIREERARFGLLAEHGDLQRSVRRESISSET